MMKFQTWVSLSNKKILKLDLNFYIPLDESIKEMIFKWSKQKLIKDLEHVRDGENEFIDERGKISNHELTEPINLIGLINSKKGTIRANHYHPQQEQKMPIHKRSNNRNISRYSKSKCTKNYSSCK